VIAWASEDGSRPGHRSGWITGRKREEIFRGHQVQRCPREGSAHHSLGQQPRLACFLSSAVGQVERGRRRLEPKPGSTSTPLTRPAAQASRSRATHWRFSCPRSLADTRQHSPGPSERCSPFSGNQLIRLWIDWSPAAWATPGGTPVIESETSHRLDQCGIRQPSAIPRPPPDWDAVG
jgi:hypothetical protein